MRSGEPSRISLRKSWISPPLKPLLKCAACEYTLQNRWLLEREERNSNDNNGVGGSNWNPATLLFFLIYRCQESIGKPITPTTSLLKVPKQHQFQPTHSIWAMCITSTSHFRRVLSADEIQRLRRLMREGSPERISRS